MSGEDTGEIRALNGVAEEGKKLRTCRKIFFGEHGDFDATVNNVVSTGVTVYIISVEYLHNTVEAKTRIGRLVHVVSRCIELSAIMK